MASARETHRLAKQLLKAYGRDQWFVIAKLAERFCGLEPDAAWAWHAWGVALSMLGKEKSALKALRTGLRLAVPDGRRMHLTALADHYERRMQPRFARKWHAQAMNEFPHEAASYIYAGVLEAGLGRLAHAETLLRKGTKCRSGAIEEAWFNLAVVVAKRGHATRARSALKNALRIDPNYVIAKKLLRELDILAAT